MSRLLHSIIHILTIILLMLISAIGLSASNFETGSNLFNDNKPTEAIPYLEKALYEDPNNPIIYEWLSLAYQQQEQYDRGLNILNTALEKGLGDRVAILNEIATIYTKKNNNTEAIKYFNMALATKPDDSFTLYKRGKTQQLIGNIPAALADYERFLVVDPKNEKSPEVARMIAALKDEILTKEIAAKQEEARKQAEAERLKEEERQKQIAAEQKRKDDEARKKVLDDIYASLNATSGEQTDLSAGTEEVKNKPADVIREE